MKLHWSGCSKASLTRKMATEPEGRVENQVTYPAMERTIRTPDGNKLAICPVHTPTHSVLEFNPQTWR